MNIINPKKHSELKAGQNLSKTTTNEEVSFIYYQFIYYHTCRDCGVI